MCVCVCVCENGLLVCTGDCNSKANAIYMCVCVCVAAAVQLTVPRLLQLDKQLHYVNSEESRNYGGGWAEC